MKNFIQSNFLLMLLLIGSSFTLYGATTVTILGPRDVCKNSITTYTIQATDAKQLDITISGGGTFVISSLADNGSSCASQLFFEPPIATSVSIKRQPSTYVCSLIAVEINISWATSGGTLTAIGTGNTQQDTKSISIGAEPNPVIVGPAYEICSSTSTVNYYVSKVPAGQTVTWTTTSTFGAPISPSTTTGIFATFTGLTPSNMYSINAQYQCPGSSLKTAGTFVITGLPCRIAIQNTEIKSANSTVSSFDLPQSNLNLSKNLNLKIYPNPVKENSVINIELPWKNTNNVSSSIKIFNIQGQLLRTLNIEGPKGTFDTKLLKPGTYYFVYVTEGQQETQKVIIAK